MAPIPAEDDDRSEIFLLPDGRKMSYAEYGSPTGRAVLFLHGHPGSRLEGIHLHEVGLKSGVRIIAPDRPWFGRSSPQPDRTLLDWPKDLERLAEQLKLESYSVLGVSGGGPYALACAYAMPSDKLKRVAIVCGLGPVSEIGMRGARWQNRLGFSGGYQYCPRFANRWFWQWQTRLDLTDEQRLQRHMTDVQKAKATMPQREYEALTDEVNARRMLRGTREAFAQSYDAALQDGCVLTSPFGIRIQDIRKDLPVQLWYGKQDVFVPLHHGETIAERLGKSATLRVEDDTHASIFFCWREEIIKSLIQDD